MASLQDAFYRSQQTKFQEVEPNRFLPNVIQDSLTDTSINNILDSISSFDPYTKRTVKPFTFDGAKDIFQGTNKDVADLTLCRQYSGLNGLGQLMRDTQDSPNAPMRCGWRYKKSPGGLCPEVSQAALGTRSGPLDSKDPIDALGNGVEWIWDLKDAEKRILTDAASSAKTAEALRVLTTACGGDFQGKLGFCTTTQKMIPVLRDGRPMFPNDPMNTCPIDKIITDPSKIPPPSVNNAIASFQQAAFRELASCADTGVNPSLSRDCLLQAIKNNGCSADGTLYSSLISSDPNQSRWDSSLKTQPSFQTYQSKQGDNAFTEKLFQRGMSDWNQAVREVTRLQSISQSSTDAVTRVAAKDLCTARGTFDTYNFCSEISESAPISSVELKCLQAYWQELNGKPAGALYPTKFPLSNQLGTINTYGDYKAAVKRLQAMLNSSDPIVQRTASTNFLGVRVSSTVFSPKTVIQVQIDESPPCLGLGSPSADRAIRLYTKTECDTLNGNYYANGECLLKTGGSFSWNCRGLNAQPDTPIAFWLDAMDSSTLLLDGKNGIKRWKDKSGQGRELIQNESFARPVYTKSGAYAGIEFQGTNQFLEIPRASEMVRNQFTIFVVEKRKSAKSENYFMGGTNLQRNANLVLGYANERTGLMAFWANDTAAPVPSYQSSSEQSRLWCFKKPAGGKQLTIDGGAVNQSNSNTDSLISWNGAALGRYFDKFYQGILYEIIVYTTALDLEAQQKVEGYLAHKWAIASNLPSSHPYKVSPP